MGERMEFQAKRYGEFSVAKLLEHNAEFLGENVQRDTFFRDDDEIIWRIREEGGACMLSHEHKHSGHSSEKFRVREVHESVVSADEVSQLLAKHGVLTTVVKTRKRFHLPLALVTIDEVEQLGSFTKLRAENEEGLRTTMLLLDWHDDDLMTESYLTLMQKQCQSKCVQLAMRWHDRIGELTFGICSGILTALGLLVGMAVSMAQSTNAKLAVIAAIITIAVADSGSDAFGVYMQRRGERGVSRATALRYAFSTLVGKFGFPLTFVVPIALLPLNIGVWVDIAWGLVALSILSTEQAIVARQSICKTACRNIGLAVAIIVFSAIAGAAVDKIFT